MSVLSVTIFPAQMWFHLKSVCQLSRVVVIAVEPCATASAYLWQRKDCQRNVQTWKHSYTRRSHCCKRIGRRINQQTKHTHGTLDTVYFGATTYKNTAALSICALTGFLDPGPAARYLAHASNQEPAQDTAQLVNEIACVVTCFYTWTVTVLQV